MSDVGAAIGAVLPLAVGIAISPVPIIAAILMLMSPRARTTSLGFLLGWLLGIAGATVLFTVVSGELSSSYSQLGSSMRGWVQVVLGLLLFLLAFKQWKSRPKSSEDASLPQCMQAIDRFSFGKAFGLAFVLAAVNPKNLMLSASAGMTIGAGLMSFGTSAVVIAIFIVIAGASVLVPVAAHAIASDRLGSSLDHLRQWLTAQNATIMAILFLVLGANVLGKGIAVLL